MSNRIFKPANPASFYIDRDIHTRQAIDNLGVTTADAVFAAGAEAFKDNPEMLAANIGYIKYQQEFNEDKISEEEFKEHYGNSGLEYDPNMTRDLVEYLIKRKRDREFNEYVMSRGKGGLVEAVGKFGAAVAASALSPTNIALSFVPVGGQLRWAKFATKYGKFRTAVAQGAVASSVFQVGFEPAIAYSRNLEQRDYTLKEAIENVGIAAVMGAGINALPYGVNKLKRMLFDYSGNSKGNNLNYQINPQLHPDYRTNNIVIDRELKDIINTTLETNTHPYGAKAPEEGIVILQEQKQQLYEEFKDKYSDLFKQEQAVAEYEEILRNSFVTDKIDKDVPSEMLENLKNETAKLDGLKKQYEDNPDYQAYIEQKKIINGKIEEWVKYQQERTGAYSLSPEDLHIAITQLQEGKYIDLSDPHNARYMSETEGNLITPESESIKQESGDKTTAKTAEPEIKTKPNALDQALDFIEEFKSKEIGVKEYLRQVDMNKESARTQYVSGFLNALEKEDLLHVFKDGKYERFIGMELYNLTAKEKPAGFTKSKDALRVAQIIHKFQTLAIERANRAGADIGQLRGYITAQTHNSYKLRQAGFDKWCDFIDPLLDWSKTRDKKGQIISLKAVFESLATELHSGSVDNVIYSRNGSLADTISASRKLHFKSADAWFTYNKMFGNYKLSDSIVLNLQRLGRSIGIMEFMGDNPRATFDSLIDVLKNDLKSSAAANDPTALVELGRLKARQIEATFNQIIGTPPAMPKLAAIASGMRSWKSMCNLGSAVISSLDDMATWVSELGNNGVPLLSAYGSLLKNVIPAMIPGNNRRKTAKMLGIFTDSMLGDIYGRLSAELPAVGAVSKATNMFFKLNLMEWWDSSFKSAMGLVLSNNLAHNVHLKFDKLNPLLKNQLSRYGINAGNWDLYKHLKRQEAGNHYLIPEGHFIPDHAIDPHLTQRGWDINDLNRDILRNELSANLRRYFLDRVDTAITTSHAAEKATTFLGTEAGTLAGEFFRFLMQFKTFPVAYIMRPLHAVTLGRVDPRMRTGVFTKDMIMAMQTPGTLGAMFHLLTATSVLGYISISAKALLSRKDIPDPRDPKVWTASVIKGGGLGIYGDLLLDHYGYGHTFTQANLGPVFGDADAIASILSKCKEGNMTQAEKEALRLLWHNTPGHNLFYLLPAITLLHK